MGGLITTGVDSLIELVKQKKEISIDDAAKVLKTKPERLESWATMLEEEGLLSIKYKFTKPFLVAKEDEGAEVAKSVKKKQKGKASVKKEAPSEPFNVDDVGSGKEPAKGSKGKKKEKTKEEFKAEMQNMTDLINDVEGLIQNGKFADARTRYDEIKNKYRLLPEKFKQEKADILNILLDLKKKLLNNLSITVQKYFSKREGQLRKFIRVSYKALKSGKFKDASYNFAMSKKIYSSLPDGYLERKSTLQEEIIQLHGYLVTQKTNHYHVNIKKATIEIDKLLIQGKKFLQKENVAEADKIYGQIKKIRAGLPPGFVQNKLAINHKVIQYHDEIVSFKALMTTHDLEAKTEQILVLIERIKKYLKVTDVANASKLYNEVNQIYTSLPNGFLETRNKLNGELSSLNKQLVTMKVKIATKDFKVKRKRVLKLLKLATKYLKHGQPDLAATVYNEAYESYLALPEGFFNDKVIIRTQMLGLYKTSVIASDETYLMNVDEKLKTRYDEVLQMIVLFHQHIDDRNFKLLPSLDNKITQLYNDFPIGFAKGKIRLVDEIKKIQAETQLYKLTSRLKKISMSQTKRINNEMDKIYEAYGSLKNKCPEDGKLFVYVKEISAPYVVQLVEKGIRKAKSVDEEVLALQKIKKDRKTKEELVKEQKKSAKEKIKKLELLRKQEQMKIEDEMKKAKLIEHQDVKERQSLLRELDRIRKKREAVEKKRQVLLLKRKKDEVRIAEQENKIRGEIDSLKGERVKLMEARELKQKQLSLDDKRRMVDEEGKRLMIQRLGQDKNVNKLRKLKSYEEDKLNNILEEQEKLKNEIMLERRRISELRKKQYNKKHLKELGSLRSRRKIMEQERIRLERDMAREQKDIDKILLNEKRDELKHLENERLLFRKQRKSLESTSMRQDEVLSNMEEQYTDEQQDVQQEIQDLPPPAFNEPSYPPSSSSSQFPPLVQEVELEAPPLPGKTPEEGAKELQFPGMENPEKKELVKAEKEQQKLAEHSAKKKLELLETDIDEKLSMLSQGVLRSDREEKSYMSRIMQKKAEPKVTKSKKKDKKTSKKTKKNKKSKKVKTKKHSKRKKKK